LFVFSSQYDTKHDKFVFSQGRGREFSFKLELPIKEVKIKDDEVFGAKSVVGSHKSIKLCTFSHYSEHYNFDIFLKKYCVFYKTMR